MTKPKRQALNIILLGEPAAGKATQSALLSKEFNLYDLDMGKELRKLQAKQAREKAALDNTIDKGHLAPTKIVREILCKQIMATPKTKGLLFDGTPKMLSEAKLVRKWLKEAGREKPLVLYLSVPYAETIARMHDRKSYAAGKFSKRADDTEAALKNRIKYYRTNIADVVEFLKSHFTYVKVSGVGTVAEVHARILAEIQKHTQ
jgi:adenylate kinase